ncbi:cartilage-associated protein-like [Lytechinus pictus]|uniref:cartilage-associated protein-like n=1 Tax=Lytechinus pictus TaxID=7653 RepID=UPI0030B9C021
MQPGCIMAQIRSISSLFAFIFINCQLWRSVDSQLYAHLGDSFLEQEVTYDELYQSGMQSYTNEDWASTIFFFERALQEFDYYRASLTECRLKCQNVSHITSSGTDALSELKVFEAVFKKADCTRRCKLDKLGGRSDRIDDAVTDKFLSMTPYSYLQFAYYKSGLYEQAVAAAYTYIQWHSDDDVMQNNLDYYRNMHGIDDSQLVNLEEKPHHKYFLEGYQAHHDEKWHEVIKNMELALTEYWKADTQCRALCEGKYDNREFMDLYEAIAYHYASTLYCKNQCESWLSRINSKLVDDYLASHYHFLQFAYYKVDDVQNAVKSALSFLLLLPEDEVMLQNIAFYKSMKDADLEFVPRTDVSRYRRLVEMENKMLEFAKKNFWEEDAEEVIKRWDGMLNKFDVDEGYEGDEDDDEQEDLEPVEDEVELDGEDGREEFLRKHGYKSKNDLGRKDIFLKAEHVLNDAKKYAEEARRYRQIVQGIDRPKAQLLKNVLGNGLGSGPVKETNDTKEGIEDEERGAEMPLPGPMERSDIPLDVASASATLQDH